MQYVKAVILYFFQMYFEILFSKKYELKWNLIGQLWQPFPRNNWQTLLLSKAL